MARKKTDNLKEISLAQTETGMVVRVHQAIKDVNSKGEEKERIQMYEGLVTKRRGGNQTGATVTVRKIAEGIGVEKIYPINVPSVKKVELVKQFKVRRANLKHVRESRKRMKEVAIAA
jgi:large subunit ribosomal protein L19